jgi:hypothetical protein
MYRTLSSMLIRREGEVKKGKKQVTVKYLSVRY